MFAGYLTRVELRKVWAIKGPAHLRGSGERGNKGKILGVESPCPLKGGLLSGRPRRVDPCMQSILKDVASPMYPEKGSQRIAGKLL